MCGIAGFVGSDDRKLLETMTESLKHRGPDSTGIYLQDGVGLGARRLAVVDLQGGDQPIQGDKACIIVFNGEIYNFKALREGLEKKGHLFKTQSDTEVIVRLYEEKGIDALKELSGIFAFAIWDPRTKRLLLARDALGVKPLYYAVSGSKIYFGSELKALRCAPDVGMSPDPTSLEHYLNYLYIPAPKTVYPGISKLQAGEWLLWQNGFLQKGVFWEPRVNLRPRSWSKAIEELDALMVQVVREQRAADVPVSLFLSGGLDSSALAYYLAKEGKKPDAFCAYFSPGGEQFNEIDKARRVAKHLGYPLTELCIKPDVEEGIKALVDALDEPMADSSALPTYWVSREARKKTKVALTGIGGDELFGGYPRYLGAKLFDWYEYVPYFARAIIEDMAPLIPDKLSSRNVGGWARRFLEQGTKSAEQAYAGWMGHLSQKDRERLFTPGFRTAAGVSSAPLDAFLKIHGDILQKTLTVDLKTYLPEDLLTHADRASMAVGLELRVPFCDQRLVEFALGLPSHFRIRGWTLKAMLKTLMKGKLPEDILNQKKQGFMIPLGVWFKGPLEPMVKEGMAGLEKRGLLTKNGLEAMFAEHKLGRRNRTDTLWAVVFLERWLKRYHPDFKI